MLHAQAPLTEIGQVLRHRSPATTAIYAKVDRGRPRELAVAWPEAELPPFHGVLATWRRLAPGWCRVGLAD